MKHQKQNILKKENKEGHVGECCFSCVEDKEYGFGDDIDGCCCKLYLSDSLTPKIS